MKATIVSPKIATASLLVAGLLVSCTAPPRALSEVDSREIVEAVTAGMKSYATALGTLQRDRIMGHYVESPDFRLTSDGTVFTREALGELLADMAPKLSKMEVVWDSIRVTPLGPEAALAVAPFRRADFAKNGTIARIRGVATWVWVRQSGRWRMLYGHGDHYPDTPAAQPRD